MNEPQTPVASNDDPLDEASLRLSRALDGVERRLHAMMARTRSAEGDARAARDTDEDRARLADALDAARARESELAEAAREAAEALDEAIEALKLTLAEEADPDGEA